MAEMRKKRIRQNGQHLKGRVPLQSAPLMALSSGTNLVAMLRRSRLAVFSAPRETRAAASR